MKTHARQQVLDYFSKLLITELGIHCDIHRVSPIPIESREALNIIINDERAGGDNNADEFEDTFGVLSRTTPMIVEVSVMSPVPHRRVNELSGLVEEALATESGDGDHFINDARVSCQYAGVTDQQDGEGQVDRVELSVIFQTSYRTEVGKPFDLV